MVPTTQQCQPQSKNFTTVFQQAVLEFDPSHYLRLGKKKRTEQFLRAFHVYSIDNFVVF